ncbi:inorganic phosphate transporter, partial [Francisella tularensis subsp. holarctica]|nr:inorganic phosphate transporter [Francisella tularensis subsp. holarctica]
ASGSIMGAGYADAGVTGQVVKKMALAWILTIPAGVFVTSAIYTVIYYIFGSF